MLHLLKKMFARQTQNQQEEVPLEALQEWLEDQVSKLEFNTYLQNYFKHLALLQKELQEKVSILKQRQISEQDQKQVLDKIKNIVIGHKNHYTTEVERFISNVSVTEKDTFSTLKDYLEALLFTENLDRELGDVATRTAKSYQATQHLFFEQVEGVFKLFGEINTLVREFKKRCTEHKISELQSVEELMFELQQEIRKKETIENDIKIKEDNVRLELADKTEQEKKLRQIEENQEYQDFLKLKERQEELNKDYNTSEYTIFSFFSRLQKALKKYGRIAFDSSESKLIKQYVEDSTKAFLEDTELRILPILDGLKNNLHSLQLDEKQKRIVLELIEKAGQNYLQDFQQEIKNIEQERKEVQRRIENNDINQRVEGINSSIIKTKAQIDKTESELHELKARLEKIEIAKRKEELGEKVREVLNVGIKVA